MLAFFPVIRIPVRKIRAESHPTRSTDITRKPAERTIWYQGIEAEIERITITRGAVMGKRLKPTARELWGFMAIGAKSISGTMRKRIRGIPSWPTCCSSRLAAPMAE
jgi:hypothetical protein